MFHKALTIALGTLASTIMLAQEGHAHGYLKTPRSRNLIANEEGVNWGNSPTAYPRETCPHCLNIGGTEGRCGVSGNTGYDYPLSAAGTLMPADTQETYMEGSVIAVDALLTAHHLGHFEFKACAISHGDVPTQACFDANHLDIIGDLRYGAPVDPDYPKRAYIAPTRYATYEDGGYVFSFEVQLPQGLVGDLVLIQWHYLTANSCDFPGYEEYPFPAAWGNMDSPVGKCGTIPPDGRGTPEQFWNCAEVKIEPSGPVAPTTASPTYPPPPPTAPTAPVVSPTYAPVPAPTPQGNNGGTCGGGSTGNGICPLSNHCCSNWGYCGTTSAYCSDPAPVSPTPGVPATPAPVVPVTPAPVVPVTPAPVVPVTAAPVVPITPAPAITATPAPVVSATPAPVVPVTPAPVIPVTPAPVTTSTPAPTPASTSDNISDWILSTDSRCGSSEADARGNCRSTCSHNGECADNQWCWGVHANYCGSKPALEGECATPAGGLRCGKTELLARETCGNVCQNDGDCDIVGGEWCYAVHVNSCDCNTQRNLRAGNSSK